MDVQKIDIAREQILNKIRYFNRRYFNPFALSFAGRPTSFWSVILHSGRRSGKAYITPVVAVRQGDAWIIPLPYGRQVDWFKNVMAAGSCDLITHGQALHASKVEQIALEEGLDAFPEWIQKRFRRTQVESLLRVSQLQAPENGQALYQSFVAAYPVAGGLWVLATVLSLVVAIIWLCSRRKI